MDYPETHYIKEVETIITTPKTSIKRSKHTHKLKNLANTIN